MGNIAMYMAVESSEVVQATYMIADCERPRTAEVHDRQLSGADVLDVEGSVVPVLTECGDHVLAGGWRDIALRPPESSPPSGRSSPHDQRRISMPSPEISLVSGRRVARRNDGHVHERCTTVEADVVVFGTACKETFAFFDLEFLIDEGQRAPYGHEGLPPVASAADVDRHRPAVRSDLATRGRPLEVRRALHPMGIRTPSALGDEYFHLGRLREHEGYAT